MPCIDTSCYFTRISKRQKKFLNCFNAQFHFRFDLMFKLCFFALLCTIMIRFLPLIATIFCYYNLYKLQHHAIRIYQAWIRNFKTIQNISCFVYLQKKILYAEKVLNGRTLLCYDSFTEKSFYGKIPWMKNVFWLRSFFCINTI